MTDGIGSLYLCPISKGVEFDIDQQQRLTLDVLLRSKEFRIMNWEFAISRYGQSPLETLKAVRG